MIQDRVQALEKKVIVQKAQRDSLLSRISTVENELTQLSNDIEDLEKIHAVITTYAKTYQEGFLRQIEDVVTTGLQAIFETDMVFTIEQVVSGKRLEVKFSLTTGDLTTGVMDARGGGVGAVIGFLLRVAILLLVPNQRKLLVLDETFAQLSVEYLPALSEFIRQLVDSTGIQVIMVTHQPELTEAADTSYTVSHNGVHTIVREV